MLKHCYLISIESTYTRVFFYGRGVGMYFLFTFNSKRNNELFFFFERERKIIDKYLRVVLFLVFKRKL